MKMAFTTFAFDGLRKGKKAKRRRTASTGSNGPRAHGRIRKGTKRPKETLCGCKIVNLKRKGRGTQPALSCPGSPMKKYVKRSQVAKLRKQTKVCTRMLKPLT